ncbi:hypothetical protein B0H19DRAFT_1244252 [Mycena capillaripes]|nr:hypothetical protein B0H19DRAFT_1244252 [Mycena capillaripes]
MKYWIFRLACRVAAGAAQPPVFRYFELPDFLGLPLFLTKAEPESSGFYRSVQEAISGNLNITSRPLPPPGVIFCLLNSAQKGRHFKKHWGDPLTTEAQQTATTIVIILSYLRESTTDSDEDVAMPNVSCDPLRPWLGEFEECYDGRPEILPPECRWGGARVLCWWNYPRNRLKVDILEALKVLKSLIKGKNMFRISPITSINEDEDLLPPDDDPAESWDFFLDNVENYEPDVTLVE